MARECKYQNMSNCNIWLNIVVEQISNIRKTCQCCKIQKEHCQLRGEKYRHRTDELESDVREWVRDENSRRS